MAHSHVGRFVQGEGEGVVQGVGNTQGVEVHSCWYVMNNYLQEITKNAKYE